MTTAIVVNERNITNNLLVQLNDNSTVTTNLVSNVVDTDSSKYDLITKTFHQVKNKQEEEENTKFEANPSLTQSASCSSSLSPLSSSTSNSCTFVSFASPSYESNIASD
jgi:hypothetical protein